MEERVKEKRAIAYQALATLKKVVGKEKVSDIMRDAAIQRFEYTFEATWKAVQAYLREMESLEIASPKGIVRESFRSGILNEQNARKAMEMVEDRNRTAHTYNEAVAIAIYSRLKEYVQLIETWLGAIQIPSDDLIQ
jgi:nucleotidyltransferase substrate binding protein (TIGR01987 family)